MTTGHGGTSSPRRQMWCFTFRPRCLSYERASKVAGMKRSVTFLVLVASTVLLARVDAGAQQSRPAITGIAFVRFYSSDLMAADGFYGKTLGYEKTTGADGITRYAVNIAQWIELEKLPANAPASRMVEVAFTTRDVKGMKRYFVEHKIPVEGSAQKNSFTVRDPEGHLIGFVQTDAMKGKLSLSDKAVSHRLIHAGIIVRDRAAEDAFYRDLLGFHLYWEGGQAAGRSDYVAMQVPDGTDWLEYMLNISPQPNAHQLGVMYHISLGVTHMQDAIAVLSRNGCTAAGCSAMKTGRDGKVQLNLYDPDFTRAELMEFAPTGPVCCSGIQGRQPGETEDR